MEKRKICFVITSQIHYARNKLIIQELKKRDDVELQLVIAGSAILKQYGNVEKLLKDDGIEFQSKATIIVEGGNPVAMAKTAGLGLIEFASIFENLNPDIVLLRGDRYEVLSAAIAAAYMNITLAHIEGGDISGSIDESVRHAITKLSNIHFTTNAESKGRVIQMGEDEKYVFDFGSPDVEFAAINNFSVTNEEINQIGVGMKEFNINNKFLIVIQHPVTSEINENGKNIEETLKAISDFKMPTLWFWPNIDAGNDEVSNAIRKFRENTDIDSYTHFIKYLAPDKFLSLLRKTSCLIGNSSAGIKESSYFGTPVVNIGSRQNGRLKGNNLLDVQYDSEQIKKAIKKQLDNGYYPQDNIYFKGNCSKQISDTLAKIKLYTQKKFNDKIK